MIKAVLISFMKKHNMIRFFSGKLYELLFFFQNIKTIKKFMMLVHKVNKNNLSNFNDQLLFYVSVSHVPKVSSITTKLVYLYSHRRW